MVLSARLGFCRQVECRPAGVFADFIALERRPSNSPDPNPLDFSVWSLLGQKILATIYYNLGLLKAALAKALNDLNHSYLRATCDVFETRLGSCIRARGEHFEWRL